MSSIVLQTQIIKYIKKQDVMKFTTNLFCSAPIFCCAAKGPSPDTAGAA
jgi:hypothetical protein